MRYRQESATGHTTERAFHLARPVLVDRDALAGGKFYRDRSLRRDVEARGPKLSRPSHETRQVDNGCQDYQVNEWERSIDEGELRELGEYLD
jgi:hypothetical protein